MATRTRRNTNASDTTSNARMSPSNGEDAKGADTATSRRMRKRELDRRCQRIARERTKNRISYLEALVEDFRKQDSTGQVATLMRQLENMQKDRDSLAKTLQGIQNSIQTHQSAFKGIPQTSSSQSQAANLDRRNSSRYESPDDGDGSPDPEPIHKLEESDDDIQDPQVQVIEPPTTVPQPSFHSDPSPEEAFIQTPSSNSYLEDPIFPRADEECECCSLSATSSYGSPVNMWRFANEVLTQPTAVTQDINEFEDAIADDTPIRALLEGWDAVAKRYGGKLPPSWVKLRRIDEVIFGRCNNRERLAIMRVMHTLMRYHTDRTQERKDRVPAWYLQRPSQTMAHSYAIDYFAWPGLRERFVFYQHRYCGNIFWHLFCNSLRISWPFEFRDCYTRNLETGEYQISPSFDTRIGDINAWTMRADIFKRWPEFYSDFPRHFEAMPMHITPLMPPPPTSAAPGGGSSGLIEAGPRKRRTPRTNQSTSLGYHQQSNTILHNNTASTTNNTISSPDDPTEQSRHQNLSFTAHSTEDTMPLAFWDLAMDSSYSQIPAKGGLADLLGQGHYADFSGRSDFVF